MVLMTPCVGRAAFTVYGGCLRPDRCIRVLAVNHDPHDANKLSAGFQVLPLSEDVEPSEEDLFSLDDVNIEVVRARGARGRYGSRLLGLSALF
jgi:hypothetical protein